MPSHSIIKKIRFDRRGIALLLVMSIVFVVVASITVGAGLVIANLDSLKNRTDLAQTEASLQAAKEKIRGFYKIDNNVFDGCQADDCFSVVLGRCSLCYSETASPSENIDGDISYRARFDKIVFPTPGVAGYVNLGLDAYYRKRHLRQSDHFCLDSCAASGHTCGDNGCGGSCGECAPSETCGGGGTPGVCDTGNCSDINLECGDGCIEGGICGGGMVIDSVNNIVAVNSGCTEDGTDCGGSDDTIMRVWDSGDSANTSAENLSDGRVNSGILNPLVNARYEAAAYCESLSYGGYDWYLPAKDELDAIYVQKVSSGLSVLNDAYWSSSDHDGTSDSAWYQDMSDGSSGVNKKSTNIFVRCVRRY